VPNAVLSSSAKKKPEPQLYESIQIKTFFDINGKNKRKQQKILLFQIGKKVKKRSRVSSIPNQFTREKSKYSQKQAWAI